jgi:hypothetical protein
VLLVAAGAALVAVVALGGAASTEQRFRLAAPLLAAGLVVAALAELVALARVEWHRGNVPVRRYAVVQIGSSTARLECGTTFSTFCWAKAGAMTAIAPVTNRPVATRLN